MTVYASPHLGFTTLSWEPPPDWSKRTIKERPGRARLQTVFGLGHRDYAFYTITIETGQILDLHVQGMLKRDDDEAFHICGRIDAKRGAGWHYYWAFLRFGRNSGGLIAVSPETDAWLRRLEN